MKKQGHKQDKVAFFRDQFIKGSGVLLAFGGITVILLPLVYYVGGLTDQMGYQSPFGMFGPWYQQILIVVTGLVLIVMGYGLSKKATWGDWLGMGWMIVLVSLSFFSLIIDGTAVFELGYLLSNAWWTLLLISIVHRRVNS